MTRLFPRTRSLWFGLTLPLRSLKLIATTPSLLVWSILPVTITLALYGFLVVRLREAASAGVLAWFASMGWSTSSIVAWIAVAATQLLLFIVAALTFSLVASIVASPFNDFLAERAERFGTPPLPPVSSPTLAAKARLIAIDLLKTLAATAAGLAALLISWIPVLNAAALLATFLLVAFQYLSYPQTRRGQGLRQGLAFLWKHPFACGGFGAVTAILFAIPVVSSLSLPLAVVGGTLLFARAQAPGLK